MSNLSSLGYDRLAEWSGDLATVANRYRQEIKDLDNGIEYRQKLIDQYTTEIADMKCRREEVQTALTTVEARYEVISDACDEAYEAQKAMDQCDMEEE